MKKSALMKISWRVAASSVTTSFFLSTVSEATKMTHFSLHNICNILNYAVPYALST